MFDFIKKFSIIILALYCINSVANEEVRPISEKKYECLETYFSSGRVNNARQHPVKLKVRTFTGVLNNGVNYIQKHFKFSKALTSFGFIESFSLMKFLDSRLASRNLYLCDKPYASNCRADTGFHLPHYIPSSYTDIDGIVAKFVCNDNTLHCDKVEYEIINFSERGIIHFEKSSLEWFEKASLTCKEK